MTRHAPGNAELQDKRSRQSKITQERDLLMAKAQELSTEWYSLERECRRIERKRPLSKAAQDRIVNYPGKHVKITKISDSIVTSQYLEAFENNRNIHFLLFAMKSALFNGEPVPQQCSEWFNQSVRAYQTKLHKMQEGGATPCLADELGISSPTSDTKITSSINSYFIWYRNRNLASHTAFLISCFERMTYTEARTILVEAKYYVPRGDREVLVNAINSADAMLTTLGSKRDILARYAYLYDDWDFDQILTHIHKFNFTATRKTNLESRIRVLV